MSIIERVTALGLPLDEIVVIGSGLLDALQLRVSNDVDLVVSESVFERLKSTEGYIYSLKYGEQRLEKNDLEIWRTWGNQPDETYEMLRRNGVEIAGVWFCSPDMIIRHKEARRTPKDIRDVAMLREYVQKNPGVIQ